MKSFHLSLVSTILAVLVIGSEIRAQGPGTVLAKQKISELEGGFVGQLYSSGFGSDMAILEDLDGDGVAELAVGGQYVGQQSGAFWIFFLESDGTVSGQQYITEDVGGFDGNLGELDLFGASVESLGDLDGDGISDVAVGAPGYDLPFYDQAGAVWVLFLNADGTVRDSTPIWKGASGFEGIPWTLGFGSSLAALGDLDGDGVTELAVGAMWCCYPGQVWILFLNADGTVKFEVRINEADIPDLDEEPRFGDAMAALDDLDGDGVPELAVGAPEQNEGGVEHGAVYVLRLNADGTLKAWSKISDLAGGFTGELFDFDRFGDSLANVGDLDGNGTSDLVSGTPWDYGAGFPGTGAAWVLFLESDGTVQGHQKIGDETGGFGSGLGQADFFGKAMAPLGDLDGDGRMDLVVSADDRLETGDGALWMLFLDGAKTANWTNLHQGLAGGGGQPTLVGEGTLVGGEPVDFTVTGAAPSTTGFLLVGFSELNLPVAGGTLVPNFLPPGVIVPLPTVLGEVSFGSSLPASYPSGTQTFAQLWVVDPSAPYGYSVSNAVLGESP